MRSQRVCGLVLLLLLTLGFAPAPLPRRRPQVEQPPPPCVLVWYGARYHVQFAQGGAYAAHDGRGERWAGTWKVLAGRVEVREVVVGGGPAQTPFCWSASMTAAEGSVRLEQYP